MTMRSSQYFGYIFMHDGPKFPQLESESKLRFLFCIIIGCFRVESNPICRVRELNSIDFNNTSWMTAEVTKVVVINHTKQKNGALSPCDGFPHTLFGVNDTVRNTNMTGSLVSSLGFLQKQWL